MKRNRKCWKKNNPYNGLFCSVKFSFSNILIKRTVFRIAEKGVVIAQGNDDDTDMRIPWNEIENCGWHDEAVLYPIESPCLNSNLLNGGTITVHIDIGFTSRGKLIHLLRGIARIVESNRSEVES
ncbi:hypothetical protein [uncultured Methanobrevibacter sp.]|mgnify:CR=1 FL=1|uniref:hypothetical protein n=1 Tax=uncultured Methanobrevibacter sp. TaxID=253161 RepID=UPI00262CFC54|nr:hypothetical protein [uncultured Methanobrevibacter sp.]